MGHFLSKENAVHESPALQMRAIVRVVGKAVPVTAAAHISPDIFEKAIKSTPFHDWCSSMDPKLAVQSVTITDVDMFGPRVGFLKFKADVSFQGKAVPGVVFMRGGAVAILLVLKCGNERYVVCTRQPRVPVGMSNMLELPAGMLDGSGNFAGVAAKELEEETGIKLHFSDLVDMTDLAYKNTALRGMYPSPGGSDEFIRLFYTTISVVEETLKSLQGKATGNYKEGENIVLQLVPFKDLWRSTADSKALSSLALLNGLAETGLLRT